MKKWLIYMLLLFCMTGCGQKEVQTEQEMETFEEIPYGCITVDESGIIYTVQYEKHTQCISFYDSNGVCLGEKTFDISTGGSSYLEAGNGVLYLVVPELDCFNVLYKIDTTTWQAKRLYDFEEFNMIHTIVPVGEDVYVLGKLKNPPEKQFSQYSEDRPYFYTGKVLVKFSGNAEESEPEYLPIEFPQEIFAFRDEILGVYCYTEENGFVLCEYTQGKLEQKRQLMDGVYSDFRGCGEGFIYLKNEERMCYGTMDEDAETDIMTSSYTWGFGSLWMSYKEGFTLTGTFGLDRLWLTHKDGFFYVKERGEEIQIVSIDTILKGNNTLQFLSSSWISETDVPDGCGYKMKKQTLDAEAFAQKVLAQDTDFDLYLLSSIESTSYNLKENGAFYPLNEVEGVQEYLDACFPYVKETATNEDGDIWMIPVSLAIPGLVYNKQFCAENDIDFIQMNLAEFVALTAEARKENTEYVNLSGLMLRKTLFGQYMSKYDTFDTVLLLEYVKQYKEVEAKNWKFTSQAGYNTQTNLRMGINSIPNFYYDYIQYQSNRDAYMNLADVSTFLGIAPIPKLEEGIPNMGTMTFMMVNPKSENLEDTLRYISDYAKAALKVRDSYLLADKSTYTDTPFAKECYELYANGGIVFEMDSEVYLDTFNEYLNGTIGIEEMITEMERRRKVYLGE